MVTKFNPARIRRIACRITASIYRRLVSRLLSKMNLATVLDRALPAQLDKYSVHIEWEIDFLDLDLHAEGLMPTIENTYLNRKIENSSFEFQFPNPYSSNIAIILQGPIVSKNGTTLRIVNFYKKRYPKACIIVSTWKETNSEALEPFSKLAEIKEIQLVLNTEPDNPGVFNVNRQIVSTKSGLIIAEGEYEYAIKSRTDQVFTDPRFMAQLGILLDLNSPNSKRQNRIVISSMNTFAFRLYGASDMFHFGRTRELLEYWDQPLDIRSITDIPKKSLNLELEARTRVAEVYLNTNYFSYKYNKEPAYTFAESLNFLSDSFVVADSNSLGHRWLKNTNLGSRWRVCKFPNKFYEITHIDWMELQDNADQWMQYADRITSQTFHHDK